MKPIGYYLFRVFDRSKKSILLDRKIVASWMQDKGYSQLADLKAWWVITNECELAELAELPPWPEALQAALTLMHEDTL